MHRGFRTSVLVSGTAIWPRYDDSDDQNPRTTVKQLNHREPGRVKHMESDRTGRSRLPRELV